MTTLFCKKHILQLQKLPFLSQETLATFIFDAKLVNVSSSQYELSSSKPNISSWSCAYFFRSSPSRVRSLGAFLRVTMRPDTLWITLVLSYPIIFIVSVITSIFIKVPSTAVSENHLVKALNKYFVEYGYVVFTLSYFATTINNARIGLNIKAVDVLEATRKYVLLTICAIAFNVWFFGNLLFERIDKMAGGHCALSHSGGKELSQRECANIGFEWISGFDLSGHFYILTTISLAVANQILRSLHDHDVISFGDYIWVAPVVQEGTTDADFFSRTLRGAVYKISDRDDYSRRLVATNRIFSLFLITLWMIMFAITAIFFHTFWEKASLLVLSLGLSLVILRGVS